MYQQHAQERRRLLETDLSKGPLQLIVPQNLGNLYDVLTNLDQVDQLLKRFKECLEEGVRSFEPDSIGTSKSLVNLISQDPMIFFPNFYVPWLLDYKPPPSDKMSKDQVKEQFVRDSKFGILMTYVTQNYLVKCYFDGIMKLGILSRNAAITQVSAAPFQHYFGDQRDDKLFPIDLLNQAMDEGNLDQCLQFLINRTRKYFPENFNFQEITETLSFRKFSVDYIRCVIKNIKTDDLEKSQNAQVEFLVSFLCLHSFQNIDGSVLSLKEDYISVLPWIFKYNQVRTSLYSAIRTFHFRSRGFKSYGGTLLHYYSQYFQDSVEKDSEKYFNQWTERLKPSAREMLNAMGVLNTLGVNSPFVKNNLKRIYKILGNSYLVINHQQLQKQISIYLTSLIKEYSKYPSDLAEKLVTSIINTKGMFKSNFINSKLQHLYDLFEVICIHSKEATLKNLDEIFDAIVQGDASCQRCKILNNILISLGEQFKELPDFDELYSLLFEYREFSRYRSTPIIESIIRFNSNFEQISSIIDNSSTYFKENANFAPNSSKSSVILYQFIMSNPNIPDAKKKEIEALFYNGVINSVGNSHPPDLIFDHITSRENIEKLFKHLIQNSYLSKSLCQSTSEIVKHYAQLPETNPSTLQQFIDLHITVSPENLTSVPKQLGRFINIDENIQKALFKSDIIYKVIESQIIAYSEIFMSFIDRDTFFNDLFDRLFKESHSNRLRTLTSLLGHLIFDNMMNFNESVNLWPHVQRLYQQPFFELDWKESKEFEKYQILDLLKSYYSSAENEQLHPPTDEFKKLLQTNLIEYLKSLDNLRRRIFLKRIKDSDIKLLDFLFDSSLTGHHYLDDQQEFSQSTPHVQNTIIQNIIGFLFRDPSVQNSQLLQISLASKKFFGEVQKLYANQRRYLLRPKLVYMPQGQKIFLSDSPLSLIGKGCYHIDYADFQYFPARSIVNRFYSLQSLNINSPFVYRVNQETNLSELTITTSHRHHSPIQICAIQNLIEHSHKLEVFSLNLESPNHLIDSIFELVLKNNPALKLFNLNNPIDNQSPSLSNLLARLKSHQESSCGLFQYKVTPNTFQSKNQNFLQFVKPKMAQPTNLNN